MGLYTKINKQLDNYYELVSINKRLARRNCHFESYNFILFNF